MKNKKKLIKRIGALLCALVISFVGFGSDIFYADIITSSSVPYITNLNKDDFVDIYDYNCYLEYGLDEYLYFSYGGFEYFVLFDSTYTQYSSGDGYVPWVGDNASFARVGVKWTRDSYGGADALFNLFDDFGDYYSLEDVDFSWDFLPEDLPKDFYFYTSCDFRYKYTGMSVYEDFFGFTGWSQNYLDFKYGVYNSALGYLQNVTRQNQYIRGDIFYNYDEDSLKRVWTHDLISSSGVDLTSGIYKIRHYVSKATVKGYEKSDIVEMSDMYLMDEFDASVGRYEYLQVDYDEYIHKLGYDDLGFIDKYLKGYFILEHNYFQIYNFETNEVGGFLHIYPLDANSDNFGVEYVYEGTDLNGNVDENFESGIIDDSTGAGSTYEDAEENAEQPKLDDLSGMQEFIDTIKAYGFQVENVSKGFGALLGEFPPWVSGVLGLSFALLFIVVIVSAMKG